MDWTLVVTTLGTATVTGGLGYFAAKRSADVAIQSIQAENERTRNQIEAENERLRAQHREDHLRNRQTTYHLFMTADRRMSDLLRQMSELLGQDSLRADVLEKYDEWHHLAMGVVLFGSDEARDATVALVEAYGDVFDTARRRAIETGKDEDASLAAYLNENNTALQNERMLLIAAMRADVGPA